jgi:peptide/nickel transport system permease protein
MLQGQASATGLAPVRFRRTAPLWLRMARLARRKPLGAAGLIVIVLLVFTAIFADVVAPYDPIKIHPGQSLKAPGTVWSEGIFLLGTDDRGRDVLSRIIHGSRISLQVGFMAVGLGITLGSIVGLISGFLGGTFDLIAQRFVDALQAMPGLIFAMAVVAVLGPGTTNVFLAIGINLAPRPARVVRGAVLSIKQNMYVEAARALGATNARILLQHIFPNVTAPIIILASVTLGTAILTESSLSFLGLGTVPPDPSWGSMLSGTGRARLAFFPGFAISIVVFSFNMLGDALRDLLDPKLRGR